MDWKIDLTIQREFRDWLLERGHIEEAEQCTDTESVYEGEEICLLTLEELRELKIKSTDTIIIDITGQEVYAKDMDEDTRGGYVAAGFLK